MSRPYRHLLVALTLLAGPGLAESRSPVPPPKAAPPGQPGRVDLYGDPLPTGAVARLGSLRLRHPGVQDFTFSPDGKRLISAGTDRYVRVWDVATGKAVRATRLQGKSVPTYCVAISPDGAYYSVTDTIKVYIWDTRTGKKIKELAGPGQNHQVNYMYFSPDGKTLAVGSNTRTLTLWDWNAGKSRERTIPSQQQRVPGVFNPFSTSCQASFSPNSKLLATSTNPQDDLAIWDVTTGTLTQSLHAQAIASAFSPDNKELAVTSQAGGVPSLRVFDVTSGKEVLHTALPNKGGSSFGWITWSPDGKTILPTNMSGAYLIDRQTGKEVRRLQGPGAGMQRELYFSPNGKLIAGMGQVNGRLRLWDATTGKELHANLGTSGEADTAAYSADGRLFATGSTSYGGGLDVWDVATGRPVHALELPAGNRYFRHVSFLDNGRTLVAGLVDGTLEYYDVATGKLRRKLELPKLRKQRPQYSQFQEYSVLPGGQRVLTLERLYNQQAANELSVWETNPGRLVTTQVFPVTPTVNQFGGVYIAGNDTAAWAAFGDSVALGTGSGIVIVDGDTGMAHVRIKGHWGGLLAASPDGRLLAGAERGQGGQLQANVGIVIGGNVVQMNSGGEPAKTGAVHIWETASGKEIAALKTGPVHCLALAADNRTLLTADTTAIHLWDVPTGRERGQIPLPDGGSGTPGQSMLLSLHPSPDGRHLATPVRYGNVLIWELSQRSRQANAAHLDDKELARLWDALAGKNGAQAYAALWKLAASPDQAVALLREHLKAATQDDPGRVQKLVANLDSKRFRVRESATRELAQLGTVVVPELRKALGATTSPEVRRRLELILRQASDRPPSPDTICHLRAVQVLEQIGNDPARALLTSLAGGVATAPETRAAREALDRLRLRQR